MEMGELGECGVWGRGGEWGAKSGERKVEIEEWVLGMECDKWRARRAYTVEWRVWSRMGGVRSRS